MAKAPSKNASTTKVTRITASDAGTKKAESTTTKSKKTVKTVSDAKDVKKAKTKPTVKGILKGIAKPFVAFGRYFKGAWAELRQVRWPDRKSTWGMTGALIAFTAFFVIVILLLDYLFSLLFKLILGSN